MFLIGNTGWTVERKHHITVDGVDTYWELSFDDKVTVLMDTHQLKALAARLVLEANDIDPRWDRP